MFKEPGNVGSYVGNMDYAAIMFLDGLLWGIERSPYYGPVHFV